MSALALVLALLAGIAVAVQAQFMGRMDRTAGTVASIFVTYGLGGLIATLLWLVRGGSLAAVRQIPGYAWTAGMFGLVIVGGIGYAAPRLGLSRTIIITIAAQLAAAVIIDHFGLLDAPQRSVDGMRIVGMVLTVVGAWLVVR